MPEAHGNAPTSVVGCAFSTIGLSVSLLSCFDRYEQLACLQTASVVTTVVPCSLAAFTVNQSASKTMVWRQTVKEAR